MSFANPPFKCLYLDSSNMNLYPLGVFDDLLCDPCLDQPFFSVGTLRLVRGAAVTCIDNFLHVFGLIAMESPAFFKLVPEITLIDPLADFLGAAEGGLVSYSYTDAVKLAGHSCPTVASAYWLGVRALQHLYPDAVPQRGSILVDLRQTLESGTTGVVANVLSQLTGAGGSGGFAGIGGRFVRRNLMHFGVDIASEIRFTRTDTGQAVLAQCHVQKVRADPRTMPLMQACLSGTATATERQEFGQLWQARVEQLLLVHGFDDSVFDVRAV